MRLFFNVQEYCARKETIECIHGELCIEICVCILLYTILFDTKQKDWF